VSVASLSNTLDTSPHGYITLDNPIFAEEDFKVAVHDSNVWCNSENVVANAALTPNGVEEIEINWLMPSSIHM